MKIIEVAYATIVAAALTVTGPMAYGQSTYRDLEPLLTRSCLMTEDHIGRLASGEIVINAINMQDKKEVSLCGAVRLDRTLRPTLLELRNSLIQKIKRSILANGSFSDPPTKLDLQDLKLEKKDLDTLAKCKPRSCSLLVSDALLQTLAARSDWQPIALQDLYMEDLTLFVRDFRANGIHAVGVFDGSSIAVPLEEQNKSLIDRVPLLGTLAPELLLYVRDYPARPLVGTETRISWCKLDFGLKPVVTVTGTTAYSPIVGDWPPVIVTHQIYASRYINASVDLVTVVSDETGQLYLVFADISRSDALGGLLSSIKRGVVTRQATEHVTDLLGSAKLRLEGGTDTQEAKTRLTHTTDEETAWPWYDWVNPTALVAGIVMLVLAIAGMKSVRRPTDTYQ